jgi:hypothetical protein
VCDGVFSALLKMQAVGKLLYQNASILIGSPVRMIALNL